MKEQDYQRKIIKYLETRGAYVVKVITASKKGVPDVLACYKGQFIGIEVKTPLTRSNVSKLQQYNLNTIVGLANGWACVAVEVDDVKSLLELIDEKIK